MEVVWCRVVNLRPEALCLVAPGHVALKVGYVSGRQGHQKPHPSPVPRAPGRQALQASQFPGAASCHQLAPPKVQSAGCFLAASLLRTFASRPFCCRCCRRRCLWPCRRRRRRRRVIHAAYRGRAPFGPLSITTSSHLEISTDTPDTPCLRICRFPQSHKRPFGRIAAPQGWRIVPFRVRVPPRPPAHCLSPSCGLRIAVCSLQPAFPSPFVCQS
ncbi:hypothetical protein B0T25DRAFT_139583 [Lasiosphaeria hispida]|uniref:Uncharacterized protein n=1 Tax=Lasiosphaeria hispida TaxID=260671 RepID=A0AAJ0MFI4_9PEZI|nr:hypothetical protein B0T25DRAFT_139583 [Lasiosphaeria hispida]